MIFDKSVPRWYGREVNDDQRWSFEFACSVKNLSVFFSCEKKIWVRCCNGSELLHSTPHKMSDRDQMGLLGRMIAHK